MKRLFLWLANLLPSGGWTQVCTGLVLPTLPRPRHLLVCDLWQADDADVAPATSLQGIVNRKSPRILLLYERWQMDERSWQHDLSSSMGVSWRGFLMIHSPQPAAAAVGHVGVEDPCGNSP